MVGVVVKVVLGLELIVEEMSLSVVVKTLVVGTVSVVGMVVGVGLVMISLSIVVEIKVVAGVVRVMGTVVVLGVVMRVLVIDVSAIRCKHFLQINMSSTVLLTKQKYGHAYTGTGYK